MPPAELRIALQREFADWKSDLSSEWRALFDGTNVDPSAVRDGLPLVRPTDVIFPGRKGAAPPGARSDTHVARAFDGITPDKVRVVVIGQDPYPQVSRATGRSFEQADVDATFAKASPSLKRIVQALALVRTSDRKYAEGATGWQRLLAARTNRVLDIPAPKDLWDRWQNAGVLFINAAMTFNKFQQDYQRAHLAFWAPVVAQLASRLVRRNGPGVVFVAWGKFAESVLRDAEVEKTARACGRWGTHVAIVVGPHPNATGAGPPFLAGRDPLGEVNAALVRIHEAPIPW